GAAAARCGTPVPGSRRAAGRPRAVLPAHPPGRARGDAPWRGDGTARRGCAHLRGAGRPRARGRAGRARNPPAPAAAGGPPPGPQRRAILHGHCHQKAFGLMGSLTATLQLVPGLEIETLGGSCCGMAGTFGYEARHLDVSMRMAERTLLPAVRRAPEDALVVA